MNIKKQSIQLSLKKKSFNYNYYILDTTPNPTANAENLGKLIFHNFS